jgi:glycosyltransferase involved in cell wall biosynthesis
MIPTISILVPAYNAERHIEACLRSILQQMTPQHALIVIDDGSTDATAPLVESLRQAHPAAAFTLGRQENQGIALTRNRLLDSATGKYVLFVDADDLLLPGALAALDEVIARERPDVIACDFNDWHPHNMRRTHRVSLGYPANVLVRDREEILRTFFIDRHTYVWANVMRREIYARQPAPLFPPGRKFEDLTVLAQLLSDCGSLYRLARPTIDYRQHRGSLKRSVSRGWCRDFALAVLDLRRHFEQTPSSDSLRLYIDVAAVHFYIGILKATYGLPWSEGKAARAEVAALLARSLFHDLDTVLAAMEEGTVKSHNRRADRKAAAQMRKALGGSLVFTMVKMVSRKLKMWQRMASA